MRIINSTLPSRNSRRLRFNIRATKASISLAHVKARYRWMLTGTPVTNSLCAVSLQFSFSSRLPSPLSYRRADIYGLLRFGRFRPWNDWNDFNLHVVIHWFLACSRLSFINTFQAKVQFEDAPLAGVSFSCCSIPPLLHDNQAQEHRPS